MSSDFHLKGSFPMQDSLSSRRRTIRRARNMQPQPRPICKLEHLFQAWEVASARCKQFSQALVPFCASSIIKIFLGCNFWSCKISPPSKYSRHRYSSPLSSHSHGHDLSIDSIRRICNLLLAHGTISECCIADQTSTRCPQQGN